MCFRLDLINFNSPVASSPSFGGLPLGLNPRHQTDHLNFSSHFTHSRSPPCVSSSTGPQWRPLPAPIDSWKQKIRKMQAGLQGGTYSRITALVSSGLQFSSSSELLRNTPQRRNGLSQASKRFPHARPTGLPFQRDLIELAPLALCLGNR